MNIFEGIRKLFIPRDRYCMFCRQKLAAHEGRRIYATWEDDLENSCPTTRDVRSSFYPSGFCAERTHDYHTSCYEQCVADIAKQPRSAVLKATLVALATQEYAKFEAIWDEKERKQRAVLSEIADTLQKQG
jgi:hypothetical protein